MVQKLQELRDILNEGLKAIPGIRIFPSQGAFYLWVKVQDLFGKKHKGQALNSSKDFMEVLMENKKLICICGEEFGYPGYLRFSYVADEADTKKSRGPSSKLFFGIGIKKRKSYDKSYF